jgi:hypothetical protein
MLSFPASITKSLKPDKLTASPCDWNSATLKDLQRKAAIFLRLALENCGIPAGGLLAVTKGKCSIMKKSIITAISLSAILFACLPLQSCSTSETTYTSSAPGEPPEETTTTTTTTTSAPDSVVGATANAAGTIIAAPFRLVGDALSIIF